jgi:hypothetical protein
MTGSVLAAGIRRAAGWRPGVRDGARVVKIRCPYCRTWRPPRHFRRGAYACRRCTGTG